MKTFENLLEEKKNLEKVIDKNNKGIQSLRNKSDEACEEFLNSLIEFSKECSDDEFKQFLCSEDGFLETEKHIADVVRLEARRKGPFLSVSL